MTKFRNDDTGLKQIAADVAGVWTTQTVKAAVGNKSKKAIKKTTIVAILGIAVVLRSILVKNHPVAGNLIEKIIALCCGDLDLTPEELDEDTVCPGESPSAMHAAPPMPLPEIVKPGGLTVATVSTPTTTAATLKATEQVYPPAAVPAASDPADQFDLGLDEKNSVQADSVTSAVIAPQKAKKTAKTKSREATQPELNGLTSSAPDHPTFISKPTFDPVNKVVMFQFVGQGSATVKRQMVADELEFIELKKQKETKNRKTPLWSRAATAEAAPAIIHELERRLGASATDQFKPVADHATDHMAT